MNRISAAVSRWQLRCFWLGGFPTPRRRGAAKIYRILVSSSYTTLHCMITPHFNTKQYLTQPYRILLFPTLLYPTKGPVPAPSTELGWGTAGGGPVEGSAGTTGRAPVELSAVGPHLFGFSVCASCEFFSPFVCFSIVVPDYISMNWKVSNCFSSVFMFKLND